MKRMVTRLASLVVLLLLVLQSGPASAVPGGITSKSLAVKTSAGIKQVKAVYVDLNDPQVRIFPVLAQGKVGKTESLMSMAKRSRAVAAINGTFFNSYSDMQPQGNLQVDGTFHYLNNTGSSLGIAAGNKIRFETIRFSITGTVDGPSKANLAPWDQYLKNWYAWSVNRVNTNPDAITIFTPARGMWTGVKTGTNVVVSGGRVVRVCCGDTVIPRDGYVINFGSGASAQKYVERFVPGDTVTYQVNITDTSGNDVGWSEVKHTLGAGPILVRNGRVDVNLAAEGMTDPKITRNGGARSFIGVTPANQLVLATVTGATVRQLAEIAQKMGLQHAMNLDGGASSGLYYQGKYLTTPGRNLSNCLVVVR